MCNVENHVYCDPFRIHLGKRLQKKSNRTLERKIRIDKAEIDVDEPENGLYVSGSEGVKGPYPREHHTLLPNLCIEIYCNRHW